MELIAEIVAAQAEITAWRRDLHAHPELAFNETRTADFVASHMEQWGIEVTRGVGKTGVVGTLKSGDSNKAIGLRADMDALPMEELNDFSHKSIHPGRMHGCGHDGHTIMLLAAARYLAHSRKFNGTVHFIFQPAEEANENGSGAYAMIQDGLFERFAMDKVFGMHNLPGLSVGTFAICQGPVMAAMDLFDVTVTGHGTHGAMPHTGIDPIFVSAQLLNAWQGIVSRYVDPRESAVISATAINGGNSWNVIPESVDIKGSIRTFMPEIQEQVTHLFKTISKKVADTFSAKIEIEFRKELPATINNPDMAQIAQNVAMGVAGKDNVLFGTDSPKLMGSPYTPSPFLVA